MTIEMKISGIREVQASLYKFSQQLGDLVVVKSLMQGARVMQRAAKQNAPVLTGRLKRGVVARKSKIYSAKRGGNVLGVYMTLRKGKGRKDPKDAFYGRFIEDGWKPRGKNSTPVPGKKYMLRAYNSTREAAVRVIIQSVERGAEIVKRKVGLK